MWKFEYSQKSDIDICSVVCSSVFMNFLLVKDINGYGVESDIYSVGITICELGNGFAPFSEMEPLQILYEKIRGSTPFLLDRTYVRLTSFVEIGILVDRMECLTSSTLQDKSIFFNLEMTIRS